jgi:hypothetical protein
MALRYAGEVNEDLRNELVQTRQDVRAMTELVQKSFEQTLGGFQAQLRSYENRIDALEQERREQAQYRPHVIGISWWSKKK